MGQFDFEDEDRAERSREPKRRSEPRPRRRGERADTSTIKIALGVFLGLILFCFVGGSIYVVYQRQKKEREYQQRVVYEAWVSADADVQIAEGSIRIEKMFQPDRSNIAKLEKDKTDATARKKKYEEESQQRWGQHPSAFAHYHGTLNRYYQEWP